MRIYLDNNASSEIHPQVLETLLEESARCWGNPSSIHSEGQRARRLLEESRTTIAQMIQADPREIVFTSGGSEANTAALLSPLPATADVVVTAIEHPSVLAAVAELERRGHPVTRVDPDRDGVVPAARVISALRETTALVTMMLANNETGAVQPVADVGRACRERGIRLHCDAVQAAGRIPVNVDTLQADTLSIAAHKMHGPKGIGALFVRSGVVLEPLIRGGAQERRRRAGTENAPLAAAFAAAAALPLDAERVEELREGFEATVVRQVDDVTVNSSGAPRLPNTSNLCFRGRDAEGVVIGLDLGGVAASTGSACSSGRVEPSHVLLAMGLSLEDARSSVRFSLGKMTTRDEVEQAARIVCTVLARHAVRGR